MSIKELTKEEFNEFQNKNILGSFYETSEYGDLMSKYDYKVDYYGYIENDSIVAAFLLLSKSISLNVKYGYSPRGFLINYFDNNLLERFTTEVKKYFNKKGYAFIKINPIIVLNEVKYNGEKTLNPMCNTLINNLENLGYKKLKDNLYFESMLPRFNPIINLKLFDKNNLDNKLKNKLVRLNSKGLSLVKGDFYNLNSLYELTYRKNNTSSEFYKTMYKIFDEKKLIDLFLVEINYHEYLLNLQKEHSSEEVINEKINKLLQMSPNNRSIFNEKMNSDKKLNEINEEMHEVNVKIANGIFKEIVAGALLVKHNNVVSIFTSGFNKRYNKILPNHFLHYSLINYYKENNYSFLDLNGISGDFSKDSPYKGLNEFKLSWLPKVYEYIGEFDLIIKENKYSLLWSTKRLHKEFEKKGV